MTSPLQRYWQGLSPALRRYYRASLWPSLVFLAAAALHEWAAQQAGLDRPLRYGFALAPVAAMVWMFVAYLHFLRDCDELERRIELGALAWAAGIVVNAALAVTLVLDAGLAAWTGLHVAAALLILLVTCYALVRGWLHRRYA